MHLLSIDPGVHELWYASWLDDRTLVSVGCIPAHTLWSYMLEPRHLAIEVPQIYQGRVQATDQQDLVNLAVSAGRAIQAFGQGGHTQYLPHAWKGSLPKRISHSRIWNVLEPPEAEIVTQCGYKAGQLHNILDAVGIGLHHLGRKYTGR